MRINRKGMIGFPLRLAVTFLILSLAVPPLIYMANDFQDEADISSVRSEADRISDTATRLYYLGIGSSSVIKVSIIGDCYISIGGVGSYAYSIGIFMDDTEEERIFLERPTVRFIGDHLEISGNRTLELRCLNSSEGYGIEVKIVD
jgi:hypothetical protein